MIDDKKDLVIGIDADKVKSGLTIYSKKSKSIEVKLLKFAEIVDLLISAKEHIKQVKIECAFLIPKSNWHNNKSTGIASRIGKNVGENHQTSRLFCEMCEHLGIDYIQKKPLPLRWGKTGNKKISHKELENVLKQMEIKCPKSTNQDSRDSVLICLF